MSSVLYIVQWYYWVWSSATLMSGLFPSIQQLVPKQLQFLNDFPVMILITFAPLSVCIALVIDCLLCSIQKKPPVARKFSEGGPFELRFERNRDLTPVIFCGED